MTDTSNYLRIPARIKPVCSEMEKSVFERIKLWSQPTPESAESILHVSKACFRLGMNGILVQGLSRPTHAHRARCSAAQRKLFFHFILLLLLQHSVWTLSLATVVSIFHTASRKRNVAFSRCVWLETFSKRSANKMQCKTLRLRLSWHSNAVCCASILLKCKRKCCLLALYPRKQRTKGV